MSAARITTIRRINRSLDSLIRDNISPLLYKVVDVRRKRDNRCGACPGAAHSEEACPDLNSSPSLSLCLLEQLKIELREKKPDKICWKCMLPYSFQDISPDSQYLVNHKGEYSEDPKHCAKIWLPLIFLPALNLLQDSDVRFALDIPTGDPEMDINVFYLFKNWPQCQGFNNIHRLMLLEFFLQDQTESTPFDYLSDPESKNKLVKGYLDDISSLRSSLSFERSTETSNNTSISVSSSSLGTPSQPESGGSLTNAPSKPLKVRHQAVPERSAGIVLLLILFLLAHHSMRTLA